MKSVALLLCLSAVHSSCNFTANDLQKGISSHAWLVKIHFNCFHRVIELWDGLTDSYMNGLQGSEFASGVVNYFETYRNLKEKPKKVVRVAHIPRGVDMTPIVDWWKVNERGRSRMLLGLFAESALQPHISIKKWVNVITWEGLAPPNEKGEWAIPNNLVEMAEYLENVSDAGIAISLKKRSIDTCIAELMEYLHNPNADLPQNCEHPLEAISFVLSQSPSSERAKDLFALFPSATTVSPGTLHHLTFETQTEQELMQIINVKQRQMVDLTRMAGKFPWPSVIKSLDGSAPLSRDDLRMIWDPVEFISILLQYLSKERVRLWFSKFGEGLFLSNVAISANFPWIDAFLLLFEPHEIVSVCKHREVHSLMTFLLHLSPRVSSYQESAPIDKSSPAFIQWMLCGTEALYKHNPVAQKKIADYYATNYYPEFLSRELFSQVNRSGNCVLFGVMDSGVEKKLDYALVTRPTFQLEKKVLPAPARNPHVTSLLIGASIAILAIALSRFKL